MSKKKSSSKTAVFLLAFILIVGLVVRLYKIDNSITEWFSWRQSDTAAVGKYFLKENGFNLLQPRYYDRSNIQSGVDNPEGWRMVEFPLYSAAFAGLYKVWPAIPFEVWARIVNIVLSLIALAALYLLLLHEFGSVEAFAGGLFFAVSPYVVFYSRAILPDMPSTSLAVIALYFFYLFFRGAAIHLIFGSLLFALALLIKPTVIFYSIPVLYLIYKRQCPTARCKIMAFLLFFVISFVPLFLWRRYIQAFPEGIAANQWLFTAVNTPNGLETIFMRPAFFRWIFFERINNMIMGGYLTTFLIFGIVTPPKRTIPLVQLFLLSALLYLFTFQGGNVQHDYYQVIITPAIAVVTAAGVGWFLQQKKLSLLLGRLAIVLVVFILSFSFSFYQIRGNYIENKDMLLVADIIRSVTDENDLIVTDTMGDTTLLYLSDRAGYPAPYRDLSQLKDQGAQIFVTYDASYKEKLASDYPLLFENDKVLLFDL